MEAKEPFVSSDVDNDWLKRLKKIESTIARRRQKRSGRRQSTSSPTIIAVYAFDIIRQKYDSSVVCVERRFSVREDRTENRPTVFEPKRISFFHEIPTHNNVTRTTRRVCRL